jgi:hypothetical protein
VIDQGEGLQDITFDMTPTLLLLDWPGRTNRRNGRNSAWRSIRAGGGDDPLFPLSMGTLIGHLISSFLMFVAILVLTWLVGLILAWLNRYQPFSDEDLKVIAELKTAMLYLDAILYAVVSISSVWTFLKGAIR